MPIECGCERGGDCTKTTMCALQSALEDRDAEIEELRECELDLLKRLDKAEDEIERLRSERDEVDALYSASVKRAEQLWAVVDAARDMRDDYEQYGFISGKGYVDPQHDEKILHKLDAALVALEEEEK